MEMCGKRIHSFCKQLVIMVLNIVLLFNKVPYAWLGGNFFNSRKGKMFWEKKN
jgi:hypothetical protein